MNLNALLYSAPSETRPTLPPTNKCTAGCYAAPLNDCDGGPLSKEHYISKNILKQLGKFKITGLPWTPPQGVDPGTNLFALILCRRHNLALSSLDAVAGKLFKCIRDITLGKAEQTVYNFNGYDVERWLIKFFCGLLASGNVTSVISKNQTLKKVTVPPKLLPILFSGPNPVAFGGLDVFYKNEIGRRFDKPLTFACDVNKVTRQYDHIMVEFMFLSFGYYLKPIMLNSDYRRASRPDQIITNKSLIQLFWDRLRPQEKLTRISIRLS